MKRGRDDGNVTQPTTLEGGHAEAERTIEKFQSQTNCDAVLQTSCGATFHAHSIVLQAKSDYFEALYGASEWSDSRGVLAIQQVSAPSLASCLNWIYRGHITVDGDAALRDVLDAAAYLQITSLFKAAAEAVGSNIAKSNAVEMWRIARKHALIEAEAKALAMMALNFRALVASGAWADAPVDLVVALLADDRLDATREEEVFFAALAWLRSSSSNLTDDNVLRVLRQVRYARMERSFVADRVSKEPLLARVGGYDIVLAAFQDFAYGMAKQAAPRAGYRQRYVVVLGGHNGFARASDSVERFDVVNCRWEMMPRMPTARSSFAAAVLNDAIYVAGGFGLSSSLGRSTINLPKVERFDIVTGTWEAVPSMINDRSSFGMAVLNGSLYVVGGSNHKSESKYGMSSAECYTPGASQWRSLPNMVTARYSMGVAVLSGKLYVVGGVHHDDSGTLTELSSMECYDPLIGVEGSWSTLPSMRCAREGCSCTVVDGRLVVIHEGAMVEAYDPGSNTWSMLPTFAVPDAITRAQRNRLRAAGSVLLGHHLYCAGGFYKDEDGTNVTHSNRLLRMRTKTRHYEEMPPMLSRRQWPACVTY